MLESVWIERWLLLCLGLFFGSIGALLLAVGGASAFPPAIGLIAIGVVLGYMNYMECDDEC